MCAKMVTKNLTQEQKATGNKNEQSRMSWAELKELLIVFFFFEIRIEWVSNGQTVKQTHNIEVLIKLGGKCLKKRPDL